MRRLLFVPLVCCVALSVAGPVGAAAEDQDSTPPPTAGPTAVELDHGTNWDDAAHLLEGTDGAVGVRFAGVGTYGEAFGASASDLAEMKGSLVRDQGALPPVTHLLVRPSSTRGSAVGQTIAEKSSALPRYERSQVSQGRLRATAGQVLERTAARSGDSSRVADDGSGDEEWAPPFTEIMATNGEVDAGGVPTSAHTVDTWMQWTDSTARTPEQFPDSWVLEAGIDTYAEPESGLNPGGLFQRPYCPRDNNDAFFWSGYNPNYSVDPGGNFLGWSLSTLDQSLVPTAFGAYLDYNLALDECERKSISIGIAYPQDAPGLSSSFPGPRGFISTIYMPQGYDSSNKFTSSYQLVSNDCSGEVTTNCTGIGSTTTEDPPNGYSPSSLVVGPSKNYRVPGCYSSSYSAGSTPEICY